MANLKHFVRLTSLWTKRLIQARHMPRSFGMLIWDFDTSEAWKWKSEALKVLADTQPVLRVDVPWIIRDTHFEALKSYLEAHPAFSWGDWWTRELGVK